MIKILICKKTNNKNFGIDIKTIYIPNNIIQLIISPS